MGRKYTDNAKTTLAGGISAVATTLTVAAGKGDLFPQVTGAGAAGSAPNSFVIKLKNAAGAIEKMRVEHRAAASDVLGSAGFPLVRGYDGTVAQAWIAGDFVSLTVERVAAQGWEDGFNADALGRAFGYKDSTTVGLNFGYYGGLVSSGGALTTIADGTVALTGSQTNFVERTTAGVVSANIAGFTAGSIPLYTVVTSATAITAITEKRSTFMQDASGGFGSIKVSQLSISTAVGKIIPGATSLSHRNNADSADNLLITDAGNVSVRALLDLSGAGAGQIKFPTSQNPSANAKTLDDYEEGTWTILLGGSATYTFNTGDYTKIGRSVQLQGNLIVNLIGTGSTDSISPLPFTPSNGSAVAVVNSNALATAVVSVNGWIPNGSGLSFKSRTAANAQDALNAIFGNGSSIVFAGHYHV